MHAERPTILCCWLLLNFTLFTSTGHAQVGDDSRLYNGREYIRNGTPAKGFPFFEWDTLHPGSMEYDGITYRLPLEYDLAQDKLVIHNYGNDILISLVDEKIDWFSIGQSRFRYFGPGAAHLPEPGFYQELFASGPVTLLARKHKNLIYPSSADQPALYVQINAYYLLLDSAIYKIDNEKDLLDILHDKKDDLKKYIRKSHLSFKRNMEGSLIQTMAYYQQLKS